MRKELLEGPAPGSDCTVTYSERSNSDVFMQYLKDHFVKYTHDGNKEKSLLLLFDGHKSHFNISVIKWALQNNILLFVLPAHTSHALQPLDVGCFGPLQNIYNNECHKYLRECPETNIARYNVAALGSSSYVKALSNSNLRSAFEYTDIYPFDANAISEDQFASLKPYTEEPNSNTQPPKTTTNCQTDNETNDDVDCRKFFRAAEEFVEKETVAFRNKKHNKGVSGIVSGKEITNPALADEITEMQKKSKPTKQMKTGQNKSTFKSDPKKRMSHPLPGNKKKKKVNVADSSQIQGPSGCQAIPVSDSESDISAEDDNYMSEDELCCVCKQFQPKEMKNCISLFFFVKWAK